MAFLKKELLENEIAILQLSSHSSFFNALQPLGLYTTKLFKYRTAGVREYWIVDADKSRVMVYNFYQDGKLQKPKKHFCCKYLKILVLWPVY